MLEVVVVAGANRATHLRLHRSLHRVLDVLAQLAVVVAPVAAGADGVTVVASLVLLVVDNRHVVSLSIELFCLHVSLYTYAKTKAKNRAKSFKIMP